MPNITLMRIFPVLLLVLSFSLPLHAETTDDARKELSDTLSAIKASNERQKKIEEKKTSLEHELKKLQEELVSLADDTVNEGTSLSAFEEKLDILETQRKVKNTALAAQQTELAAMLSAMIKLQQLPPEAIIAMPGKMDETLATARALGLVTKTVDAEARSLKAQLHELDELEDKIRQNQDAISKRKSVLIAKQKQLSAKVKERNKLEATLGGKEREEKQHIAQLTAKSQNIQDLLDSLEKAEHSNAWERGVAPAVKKNEKNNSRHKLRSFTDAKGRMHLPAGKIVSRFGNTNKGTAFSKGLIIDTRADARVLAPYDGEVVFAGPFRDYGHMVIIRHSNDYHTLLSGMDEINCTPGQFLLEGEPIGSMSSGAEGTHLYMELRKDGKPIDPSAWFKG